MDKFYDSEERIRATTKVRSHEGSTAKEDVGPWALAKSFNRKEQNDYEEEEEKEKKTKKRIKKWEKEKTKRKVCSLTTRLY